MNEKISSQINNLSETLLITLWAKGTEYGRPDALLEDAHAKRMMDAIDYDFGKFGKAKMSQIGSCVRAKVLDDMTRRFIAEHPDAVVVQLGAGLDARYERLGRPDVEWYDLDLPEVIALRRELLPESGNRYLAQSLFDEAWMEMAGARNRPVLLVIEGVLMYFPQKKVEAFMAAVAWHCRRVSAVFDVVLPVMVGRAMRHDALKNMRENAPEFMWSASGEAMAQWHPGWTLVEETYMSDHVQKRLPLMYRLLMRIPWFYRRFNHRMVRLDSGFDRS